jgi:HK97 family phage prohead protease
MSGESAIEWRAAVELRAASPGKLQGYAAVYNVASQDLGGFVETVDARAFDRSLAKPDGIVALYDHDRRAILGRVGAGTLKLSSDTRGLAFEIALPSTSVGKDLQVLVERGDVAGASFAFTTPKGGDRWDFSAPIAKRTLLDVDLREITVTASPAYLETSVAARAMAHAMRIAPGQRGLAWAYLQTLGA